MGEFSMNIQVTYLRALNNVTQELKIEKEKLRGGQDSLWTLDALMTVVQPEFKQLLIFASKGEVFFKYGSDHRQLESTVFILSSPEELSKTDLAKSILEFQDLYNSL